ELRDDRRARFLNLRRHAVFHIAGQMYFHSRLNLQFLDARRRILDALEPGLRVAVELNGDRIVAAGKLEPAALADEIAHRRKQESASHLAADDDFVGFEQYLLDSLPLADLDRGGDFAAHGLDCSVS